jgi:hemerythrin-like domain-containing protein
MATSTAVPGFDSPAVGFEQPFEMLHACHDRVRRSLSLLERLVQHIDRAGHDEPSRSAAADVLRYFDLAAPLHHQDEEVNVFPVLLAQNDPGMARLVHALREDHVRMSALWAALREPLARWSQAGCRDSIAQQTRDTVVAFRAAYATHLEAEEGVVFPATQALMDAAAQIEIGRQMQARRQT